MITSGHNHQYEQAWIRYLIEPPPDSTLQVPFGAVRVRRRPDAPLALFEDDPWTSIVPYHDPPEALNDPGVRRIPETQEALGWLGYALYIVNPSAAPNRVRVKAKNFNRSLELEFEDTIDLPPRSM